MDQSAPSETRRRPTFAEQFTPRLVTVLRESYGLAGLRADLLAGLTVAIVAPPLSMAIAIASGVTPNRGLHTAIVGGFMISAFDGSRFQIGGPAGAFIVLVAATVEAEGVDGLVLATMIAGLILLVVGFLRLGSYIKFIPYPVTVGFTAGIAVIIAAGQIRAAPMMDSTAASIILGFIAKARRRDVQVYPTGASSVVRRTLSDHGVRQPAVQFRRTIAEAVAEARQGADAPGQG